MNYDPVSFKKGLAAALLSEARAFPRREEIITGDAGGLTYDFDQDSLQMTVTDAGLEGNTFTLLNGVLTLNDGTGVPITFMIEGGKLRAEEGMTWGQWLESEYYGDGTVYSQVWGLTWLVYANSDGYIRCKDPKYVDNPSVAGWRLRDTNSIYITVDSIIHAGISYRTDMH